MQLARKGVLEKQLNIKMCFLTYVHRREETSQQQDNGNFLKNIILQKCVKSNCGTSNGVVSGREPRWRASIGQEPFMGYTTSSRSFFVSSKTKTV